ncbi:porin family protein [Solitalea sp. MAHUQ-68]|uniref:Porin family protein n=1 Tax=Solitalea agri TaxID=2953739 RepID=A0A9X2JBJ2_9SPHI|nr:outer membrane beta-barrel protein [Solitalea agri]MCO4292537.1 porin family protein [Solitalea agri]
METLKLYKWFFTVFLFAFAGSVYAQNDTTVTAKTDTAVASKKKEKYHRNDAFILYAGVNFNNLSVSSNTYESSSGTGWHAGVSYKREGFFYWQVGARLSDSHYILSKFNTSDTTHDSFNVTNLDIPLTVGINFLPIAKRVFNVHAFVSAVPTFAFKVGDNTLGITKDNINTFILYGQAGAGVDVLFFVIDAGFNFGFNDLIKDAQSKPNQFFVSLGFRF